MQYRRETLHNYEVENLPEQDFKRLVQDLLSHLDLTVVKVFSSDGETVTHYEFKKDW